MRQIAALAIISLVIFSSCQEIFAKRVRGNGVMTKQTRHTNSFTSVEVSGSMALLVSIDSAESLQVEADENLQDYIEVEMHGDQLRIHQKQGFNLRPRTPIKIYVSAPVFKSLEATGSSSITSQSPLNLPGKLSVELTGSSNAGLEINAPSLSITATGASTVKVKGQVKDVVIEGTGSTHFYLGQLVSDNVNLDLTGASTAEVVANVKLDVDATGSSHVSYSGNPATVNQSTTGASSIRKTN